MTDENEIGRFIFGLKAFKTEDGLRYQIQSVNDNIPVEIVIMQLRAFLNGLENEYFDNFQQGTK